MDYRELIRRGYSWNRNHFRQEMNEPRSIIAELCYAIESLLVERDAALKEPEDVPRLTERKVHRADRLKCLGNAVVPAQFFPVFRAIVKIEKEMEK